MADENRPGEDDMAFVETDYGSGGGGVLAIVLLLIIIAVLLFVFKEELGISKPAGSMTDKIEVNAN